MRGILQGSTGLANNERKDPGRQQALQLSSLAPRGKGTEGTEEIPPIVQDVLLSPGRPLDDSTRDFMELHFDHDFSQVRVHTDDQTDRSVSGFNGRAYTVGNHIAFGTGQYAPSTPDGRELLLHELIHVAQNRGNAVGISFWNKDEHHKFTQQIVDFYRKSPYSPAIMQDPFFGSEQFYQIVDSSFNMDVTAKRIFETGPKFVLGIAKGEGPEHGEDGNYSKQEKQGRASDEARDQNVRLQEAYVKKSLEFYNKEVTPEVKRSSEGQTTVIPPARRFYRGKAKVTPNMQAMFKALGDACHVAQDRGAHWEGTKGMGHDDPRAKKGTWDPDSPTDNVEGVKNARKNTYDVFKMWAWETTMSIGYWE